MITRDLIHHLLKAYKILGGNGFRECLTEIGCKVICKDVSSRDCTETDLTNNALSEYNCSKLYEDSPWGYLYGTEQDIIMLREEVIEYKNIKNTGVSTSNKNTDIRNRNKLK